MPGLPAVPRAHLTTVAKELTLNAIDATNMSGERWQGLCKVLSNDLFEKGQEADLKACSDRTVRRLLEQHDMVCLLHDTEELQRQGDRKPAIHV